MQDIKEPQLVHRFVNLPSFRCERIVLPRGRREQWCSCLFFLVCVYSFAWSIPLCLEDFRNGIHDGPAAGSVAMALSITSSAVAVFWCGDMHYRLKECTAAEKEIAACPELAYRMGLPAARVAGDHRARQFRHWRWFPYVDVGIACVIWIAFFSFAKQELAKQKQELPEQELAKAGAALSAAVLFLSVAFRFASHLRTKLMIVNASAQEICFFCTPNSAQVGFCFQGRLTLMGRAGNRNANDPPCGSRQQFLGGSQLIGSLQDPEDLTTPIISWDLMLFIGSWDGCSQFEVESMSVPIDCSKARDFGQWLSKEPARSMFGFVGKVAKSRAADNICRFPDDYAGFVQRAPLPHENSYQFGELFVITAHISYLSLGLLAVSFISLGGRAVLELRASRADRIVDFCHTVSTKVDFSSSQIEILLPDGRSLSDMNGMSVLDTLGR